VSDDLYASFGSHGWHHLGLWVDDVDAAVETLRDRGVTVTLEPIDNGHWKVRVAFIVDPWSNVIELLQPKV
jgi:catechol 2,3-dioxygenase-like lactoylglutathione lyase family enzyme